MAPQSEDPASQIIHLTGKLLQAIFSGDWETYTAICADDITAIEPEARGHLVQGLAFHRTYFPKDDVITPETQMPTITISSPHVRVMGDAALIAYVRLVQVTDLSGEIVTKASEETRIWQRIAGQWKHVHFHRSPL